MSKVSEDCQQCITDINKAVNICACNAVTTIFSEGLSLSGILCWEPMHTSFESVFRRHGLHSMVYTVNHAATRFFFYRVAVHDNAAFRETFETYRVHEIITQ